MIYFFILHGNVEIREKFVINIQSNDDDIKSRLKVYLIKMYVKHF